LREKRFSYIMWCIVALAVIASTVTGIRRHISETRHKSVDIVLDYEEARNLCLMTGTDLLDFIKRMKAVGVTSLGISEDTLADLHSEGRVQIIPGNAAYSSPFLGIISSRFGGPRPDRTYLLAKDDGLAQRIVENLNVKVGPGIASRSGNLIEVRARNIAYDWEVGLRALDEVGFSTGMLGIVEALYHIGLGFDEGKIGLAKRLGLGIVLRISNFPRALPSAVRFVMERIPRDPKPEAIIFYGPEVLGYDKALGEVVKGFVESNIPLGVVEFAKQKGIKNLVSHPKMIGRVVNVYSLIRARKGEEGLVEPLGPEVGSEKMVRSVKEKRIGMLYIRPLAYIKGDIEKLNLDYVLRIKEGLKKIGVKVERGNRFKGFVPNRIFFIAASIGVSAGLSLLVMVWTRGSSLSFHLSLSTFLLLSLVSILCGWSIKARQGMALISALAFPVLGYELFGTKEGKGSAIPSAVLRFLLISLISLIGAILITGLLSSTRFMLKQDLYRGVKLSLVLPPLLVGWRSWEKMKGKSILSWMEENVKVVDLLVIGIVGMALLVMVVRSGNFPGIPIPAFEEKARDFLEDILVARPRTKEFLIGHPLMIAYLALFISGWRRFLPIVAIGGMIGQVSMVNTFCHIYTPISLSVIRTANGLLLGTPLGVVLALVALYVLGRMKEGGKEADGGA
jgi:hypothetical protein